MQYRIKFECVSMQLLPTCKLLGFIAAACCCRMDDPSAVKPATWDDRRYIPDPHAVKPDSWLDHEPPEVPDPTATKPANWDDDKDGPWLPTPVPNPVCVGAAGCGPWKAPSVKNPGYKGPWIPPQVKNPSYKVPRGHKDSAAADAAGAIGSKSFLCLWHR